MQIFLISQTSACKCKCSLVIRGSRQLKELILQAGVHKREASTRKDLKKKPNKKTTFKSEIMIIGGCFVLSLSSQKSKANAETGEDLRKTPEATRTTADFQVSITKKVNPTWHHRPYKCTC